MVKMILPFKTVKKENIHVDNHLVDLWYLCKSHYEIIVKIFIKSIIFFINFCSMFKANLGFNGVGVNIKAGTGGNNHHHHQNQAKNNESIHSRHD